MAKGVAIGLVVLGHAIRGLQNSLDIDAPDIWRLVDMGLYAFHMPLFFALSGWFFVASIKTRDVGAFAVGRLERILWPMLVWGYLFLGAKLLAGSHVNDPLSTSVVPWLPIPGILHLWFLWDLLLLSFAFYPLRYAMRDGVVPTYVWWCAAAVCVAMQAALPLWPEPDWLDTAIKNAPFFLIGVFLGQRPVERGPSVMTRLIATALFAMILLLWPQILALGVQLWGSIVLVLCALCLLWGLDRAVPPVLARVLQIVGAASLSIYVAHTIFSAALRQSLVALGMVEPWTHFALGTVAGVALPLLLLHGLRRIRASRLFGLEVSLPMPGRDREQAMPAK